MKKTILWILGILVGIVFIISLPAFIFFFGLTGVTIYTEYTCPEPVIVSQVNSPNGTYVAYSYQRNCHIIDDYVYHVSVVKNGEKVPNRYGDIYKASENPAHIKWDPSGKLIVEYNPDQYKMDHSYKDTKEKNGIQVQYVKRPASDWEQVEKYCSTQKNASPFLSPDHNYTAYIFEGTCKSDLGLPYHLAIEKDDQMDKTAFFHTSLPFQVRWENSSTLIVEYDPKGKFTAGPSSVKIKQDSKNEDPWPTVTVIYREKK